MRFYLVVSVEVMCTVIGDIYDVNRTQEGPEQLHRAVFCVTNWKNKVVPFFYIFCRIREGQEAPPEIVLGNTCRKSVAFVKLWFRQTAIAPVYLH